MTTANGKKKQQRKWTKQDSAEFMEHLDERGYVIVEKARLEKLNEFVSSVTSGMNFADPENQGRGIAVVWQDHLELLNDIAKVVLGLGMAQQETDEAMKLSDEQEKMKAIKAASNKMMHARSTLEKVADHLANKEKAAMEAVHVMQIDKETGEVSEASAPPSE